MSDVFTPELPRQPSASRRWQPAQRRADSGRPPCPLPPPPSVRVPRAFQPSCGRDRLQSAATRCSEPRALPRPGRDVLCHPPGAPVSGQGLGGGRGPGQLVFSGFVVRSLSFVGHVAVGPCGGAPVWGCSRARAWAVSTRLVARPRGPGAEAGHGGQLGLLWAPRQGQTRLTAEPGAAPRAGSEQGPLARAPARDSLPGRPESTPLPPSPTPARPRCHQPHQSPNLGSPSMGFSHTIRISVTWGAWGRVKMQAPS